MTLLPALALALCALARAGEVVRVDFVGKSVISPSAAVSVWSPALSSLFSAGLKTSQWSAPLTGLSKLDWSDPAHAEHFSAFVAELARSGLTPEQFAKVPAHQRAEAAQRAVDVLVAQRGVRVEAEALLVEEALEMGAAQSLAAMISLLKEEAAAGPFLERTPRERVGALHRAALAKQTEARAKHALERLRRDADALRSDNPVETVLARDPAAPFSQTNAAGRLVKFQRKTPGKKDEPIEMKPGQNPSAVIKGLMLGLSPKEASKLGFNEGPAQDDFFARYPAALSAAEEAAEQAGYKAEDVHLGEARMPLSGKAENWSFTFYALKDKKARSGHAVAVSFPMRNGKPSLAASAAAPADVPEGLTPFRFPSYLLNRAFSFTPQDARRFVGEAAPQAEVGLTAFVRAIPKVEDGSYDTDLWYVVADGKEEYGRVNARTGAKRLPAAPESAQPQPSSALGRLRAWFSALWRS